MQNRTASWGGKWNSIVHAGSKERLVVMIVDGSEQQIKIFRNDRYFERSTHPGKKSKHTGEKLDVILRNQVQKQIFYATTTEIDPTWSRKAEIMYIHGTTLFSLWRYVRQVSQELGQKSFLHESW